MTRTDLSLDRLLGDIKCRHQVHLRVLSRYRDGENQGAYAVADQQGRHLVLKRQVASDAALNRITRGAQITERLQALGSPVPIYRLIGTTADGQLYYVEDKLPGMPAGSLTAPGQIGRLLELNELQARQAVSTEQDWSDYVQTVVFHDASGWAASLRAYADDTASLVWAIRALTSGMDRVTLTNRDIVHGDLSPGNILLDDGQVSGIVDWDAAGCGDRAFDLALLLFYHYETEHIRRPLRDRIVHLAGFEALCLYLTYAMLSQTYWSAHHHGRSAVDRWLCLARLILDDLARLARVAARTPRPSRGWHPAAHRGQTA